MATLEAGDLIESSTIKDDINGGASVVRSFVISGVAGTATSKPSLAINDANIPLLGSVHPDIPAVFVVSRSAKPVNGTATQWKVDVDRKSVV